MSNNINPATQNYSELLTSADAVPEQELSALSPRQLAALDLMLLGQSDTSISAQLAISRKTLYTWRTHDPNFRAAYEKHHRDLLTQSTSRFRSLMDNALDTLEKQVKDPYTPTSHRAAKTLLSLAKISSLLNPPPPKAHGSAVGPPSNPPPDAAIFGVE